MKKISIPYLLLNCLFLVMFSSCTSDSERLQELCAIYDDMKTNVNNLDDDQWEEASEKFISANEEIDKDADFTEEELEKYESTINSFNDLYKAQYVLRTLRKLSSEIGDLAANEWLMADEDNLHEWYARWTQMNDEIKKMNLKENNSLFTDNERDEIFNIIIATAVIIKTCPIVIQ